MEFKTKISKIEENNVNLRGEKLFDLAKDKNTHFTDIIFLTLSGRKPSKEESILFEKMLSLIVDHGMGTTSSLTTRFAASGGNALNVAVGAGILSIGNYHGGAIENCMGQFYAWKNMSKEELAKHIEERMKERKVIFGFGHKHYKTGDPRVKVLKELIKETNYESEHLYFLEVVEQAFQKIKGKNILANIDGMIAVLLCDFKFDPRVGKGIFIIGRTPGLVAQAFEELTEEKPVRRLNEKDITYLGK